MADETMAGDEGDLRPCAYCGTAIDARCHRCPECGGHVGLAWKTVDVEMFGLLFASVVIGIGCLVSWSQSRPTDFTGISTIRGSAMLALAAYGVIAGLMNVYHRRHVVWPMLLNAVLALWTGIGAILDVVGSAAWKAHEARSAEGGMSILEKYVGGYLRTIPPGFLLLTAAGALVAILILKGIVAGAGSAAAKKRAEEEAKAAASAERRARRFDKGSPPAAGDVPPSDLPPTEVPPA